MLYVISHKYDCPFYYYWLHISHISLQNNYITSYMQENSNPGLSENFVFDQLIMLKLVFYLSSLIIFLTVNCFHW